MTKKFTIDSALKYAFRKMKEEWRFFAGVLVAYGLVLYLPELLVRLVDQNAPDLKPATGIMVALFVPFQILVVMGLIGIALDVHDKKPHRIADLFAPYMLFFAYVTAAIVYGLIVLGGLILFIVPGIYWGVRFSFFSFFILDEQCGPIEALKKSFAMTKGEVAHLFLLQLCFGGIAIASLMIPILGPLIVGLASVLASAYVYRKLRGHLQPILPEQV